MALKGIFRNCYRNKNRSIPEVWGKEAAALEGDSGWLLPDLKGHKREEEKTHADLPDSITISYRISIVIFWS